MELGISPEWKRQIDDVVVQLRNPFKLRVTTVSVVCLIGFGLICYSGFGGVVKDGLTNERYPA